MNSIITNIHRELKLASNNCYYNVSLPCGQIYTGNRISTKIHAILTKDNIKHFEIICNNHKTLSSMVSFIRQMDNNA